MVRFDPALSPTLYTLKVVAVFPNSVALSYNTSSLEYMMLPQPLLGLDHRLQE